MVVLGGWAFLMSEVPLYSRFLSLRPFGDSHNEMRPNPEVRPPSTQRTSHDFAKYPGSK